MSLPGGPRAVPLAGNHHAARENGTGIRVVITGKGGVGKTTLTAILAHLFARAGKGVLAVDGDPQQNLAATLGVPHEDAGQIVPVSQSAAYLREKTGAGPDISPGGLLTLNPEVSDVIDRFSFQVENNLRLLIMGGVRQAGSGCLCPEYTLLAAILRHMRLLQDEVVLLDTPAGLEHFGRAVAEGFTCAVVVADPSHNALSVARESAALARQLGIEHVILVVNRVHRDADIQKVRENMGGIAEFSRMIFLPYDPEVIRTEPAVGPLFSGESMFMGEVMGLAATISGRCEVQSPEFL
jgi:CO dehydrogenase maturation factor